MSVGTTPTLIYEVIDAATYAELGYNPTDNPNVFTNGTATDSLPIAVTFTATDSVYLGGADVATFDTGALFTGIPALAYNVVGSDSLYGIVASGTSTVSVLALRQ